MELGKFFDGDNSIIIHLLLGYEVFQGLRTFSGAIKECTVNKGGFLAWPMSEKAQNLINEAIKEKVSRLEYSWSQTGNLAKGKYVWINIQETSSNSPKLPLPYKNYMNNQPNSRKQNCLTASHTNGGAWNDLNCRSKFPYICEFYGKSSIFFFLNATVQL